MPETTDKDILNNIKNGIPKLSVLHIFTMSFGFMGIQFGFALQNANTSRILRSFGADIHELPLFWLAAPIVGMLVQPVIGYYSDKTWNRLGRRKPFFLTGALLSAMALILLPNSGNMAGILCVLYTSLLAIPIPFEAVHLLFINLVTDSLPAIAIGMETPDASLLDQKPRNPKSGILTKRFLSALFMQGGLIAIATMVAFYIGLDTGNEAKASTMAFATLTLARLFHGFNCRSSHSIFKIGFSKNWYSLLAFAAGTILLALVLFVSPVQKLFTIASLTGNQVGFIALLAIAPTIVIQLVKVIKDFIKK